MLGRTVSCAARYATPARRCGPKPGARARVRTAQLLLSLRCDLCITGLTQSTFFAFGRAVLDFCWCAVFPRSARKNRTQMVVMYHAVVHPERSRRAGNMYF